MKEAFLLKVYQKRTQKSTGSLSLILSVYEPRQIIMQPLFSDQVHKSISISSSSATTAAPSISETSLVVTNQATVNRITI